MNPLFYPSKVYKGTKLYPYNPEGVTGRVMLNPVYRIYNFSAKPLAICDSGAFQDIDKHQRLTVENALKRQLDYQNRIQTILNDPNWTYEAVCIYDQMIGVDEIVINGKKIKRRGTIETGFKAIQDTLDSALYYKSQEHNLPRIVYIAQGVTPEQYTQNCVLSLLDLMRIEDYFGFGGFCIIGKQRKTMLPIFYKTCELVLPLLYKKGIKRAHILGVCLPEAISYLVKEAKKFNIQISTDSSAPEVNAVAFGRGYSLEGRPSIQMGDKWVDYNPIYLATDNVRKYTEWMVNL